MKTAKILKEKKITGLSVFAFLLIVLFAFGSGCYIPGIGALPDADDPPEGGEPMGVEDTYFGKFVKYEVADGDVLTLGGKHTSYRVGEVRYCPDDDPENVFDYNKLYGGLEAELTFPYKGAIGERAAAGYPDAMVLDGELSLFYTNDQRSYWQPGISYNFEVSADEIGGSTRDRRQHYCSYSRPGFR